MIKSYHDSYVDMIKVLYKYNNTTKDCASYFLDKYYKKKTASPKVTVEDL